MRGVTLTDSSLLIAAAVAAAVTLMATLALRAAAPRIGLRADGEMPRVGGLAIAVGLVVVAAAFPEARSVPVLIPASAALLLGLHDDLTDSPPAFRLIALVAIASLAWWLGARVESVLLPGVADPIALGAASAPVTVAAIVAIVVGFDFIDGLDGLASSLGLLAALSLALLGAPTLLAVAVVAALATFTFGANRPPASAWLGDSGSNGLGMLLATLAASLPGPLPLVPVLLIFAIPLLDAALTVVRRARGGAGLLGGELGHLHHRLAALWDAPALALAELLGVATLCTASGLLLASAPERWLQALLGAACALGILLWRTGWLGRPVSPPGGPEAP